MGEIIVGGRPLHCAAQVKNLIGTDREFRARSKRTETRAVVWHWTGGMGDADAVLHTLATRGLSINFIIDRLGVVWQCCDADRRTSHAYDERRNISANPWSVGVEVCGRGGDGVWWTQQQATAGGALARSLSGAFGLPMTCPREPDGDVYPLELSRDALSEVRGHIGHFHVERVKRDPGPQWLDTILGGGWGP